MQSFQYVILLSFRILRFMRIKYTLSVNCSLVLHGCWLYSKLIKQDFSRTAIMNFIEYFNNDRITRYFNVLLKRGFVIDSGKTYSGFPLYNISSQVNDMVKEIEESYNKEMYIFCNKYNVEL